MPVGSAKVLALGQGAIAPLMDGIGLGGKMLQVNPTSTRHKAVFVVLARSFLCIMDSRAILGPSMLGKRHQGRAGAAGFWQQNMLNGLNGGMLSPSVNLGLGVEKANVLRPWLFSLWLSWRSLSSPSKDSDGESRCRRSSRNARHPEVNDASKQCLLGNYTRASALA